MRTKNLRTGRAWRFLPTPALVVAFVALFAAMGGMGYAAAKLKPNSVKAKNIRSGAVTTDKLADGAVTTPKLAPDAVAPNAVNAMNAAKLGGAAPGECQIGWLSGSLTVDTVPLNGTLDEPIAVPGFDCASKAADAVTIQREAVGQYTVTFAGNDADVGISSSAGANAVTAATRIDPGVFLVKVWNNGDAQFVDGKVFSLIAY
ncbi:MAG TPA: hypothetical protein VFN72_09780 [Solirubrobacterales bacterium]|nr:hypothetical protein [Solirubrobacterales bacterium]